MLAQKNGLSRTTVSIDLGHRSKKNHFLEVRDVPVTTISTLDGQDREVDAFGHTVGDSMGAVDHEVTCPHEWNQFLSPG